MMRTFGPDIHGLLEGARQQLEALARGRDPAVCDDPAKLTAMRVVLTRLADYAERFHSFYENAVQGMFLGTLEGRIFEANPAFAAMLGYASVDEMLPIGDFARSHYMDPDAREDTMELLLENKAVQNLELHLKKVDGTPLWCLSNVRLFADEAGNALIEGITVDITARKQAEMALAASGERHRRILETAGEGFIFMDASLVIREVNQAYCRLVGRPREEILGRTPADFADADFQAVLAGACERIVSQEYRVLEGAMLTPEGRRVPVLIHGNTLRDAGGRVLGHAAFVADMTEHKKAMALAAEVHNIFMPAKDPQPPGLDVAARAVPSQEVGGDYYDFPDVGPAPRGTFRVVVGDVTGHGLDAALFMTMARGFLRMRSGQPGTLTDVVTDMNRHLTRDTQGSGRFMTLLLMELDPGQGVLRWVRAGHDPALVYDPAGGGFRELMGHGMALGIVPGAIYEQYEAGGLAPGHILVLGTDGIWEARNRDGEMFGKQRLKNAVKATAGQSARHILEAVFAALAAFAGPRLDDDATLVVIKALAGESS